MRTLDGIWRAATSLLRSWLPDMDLNHDKQIQSLLCYRYTIGQTSGSKVKALAGESRLVKRFEPGRACFDTLIAYRTLGIRTSSVAAPVAVSRCAFLTITAVAAEVSRRHYKSLAS